MESSKRAHNFNPGPSALPLHVLEHAAHEMVNYRGSGMSVMEMSHRSHEFELILHNARGAVRRLYAVPDNYHILFMQGGGTGQFAAVPLNLLGTDRTADYIVTGSWSRAAAAEAKKYGRVHIAAETKYRVPNSVSEYNFSDNPAYIYFCENETVDGVQFHEIPPTPPNVPLVADLSSSFLSRRIPIDRFGLVYGGAQKNIGPAGLTLVIVRDDLLRQQRKDTPLILDYTLFAEKDSLYNTPPTYNIYLTGLVFEWIEHQGGLDVIATRNAEKAKRIYNYLDSEPFYKAFVQREARSLMNVTFDINANNAEVLVKQLVDEACRARIVGIAGHRSVGGLRASIYNAVSLEDVDALLKLLKSFAQQHNHSSIGLKQN